MNIVATDEAGTHQAAIQALPAVKPAGKGHLDYIDGLRGLAIAQVLLFHIWEMSHLPSAYWWNPLSWGYAGVTLFLLLSGFCLYWPMVRPIKPSPEPSLAEFARRRAHRILPPYIFVLAACTCLAMICSANGILWPDDPGGGTKAIFVTFLWHLFMLHNLRPEHIFTLNGPFWSLALEVSLYIAMPILVYVARVRGIIWAVVLSAAVTLGYRMFCNYWVGGPAGWSQSIPAMNFVMIEFLPGQLVVFAMGMWAATLISNDKISINAWMLGAIAVVLPCVASGLTQILTRYNPFSDFLYGVGYFAIILLSSKVGNIAGMVLRWRPLVWLGQISYSVYLLHYPLLKYGYDIIGVLHYQDRVIFMSGLLLLPIIVGIAYIFHIYCERPFMNMPQSGRKPLRFAGSPGSPQPPQVDIAVNSTANTGTL